MLQTRENNLRDSLVLWKDSFFKTYKAFLTSVYRDRAFQLSVFTGGEKYQTQKKGNWNFNIGRLFICVNSESDDTLEYIVAFYVFFLKKIFYWGEDT